MRKYGLVGDVGGRKGGVGVCDIGSGEMWEGKRY